MEGGLGGVLSLSCVVGVRCCVCVMHGSGTAPGWGRLVAEPVRGTVFNLIN